MQWPLVARRRRSSGSLTLGAHYGRDRDRDRDRDMNIVAWTCMEILVARSRRHVFVANKAVFSCLKQKQMKKPDQSITLVSKGV